uniref:Ras association domain family member 11 n=1 Tax=Myripristis murdjan TaxID=586833 RepID=A0A668A409_9TELE
MEVKVSVDGVPRVVCGVTEKTTCQEVVIALAQALGQPGRYTLREKFKDFERSMTPDERLLESLEKYDQQAKDVQLTLLHNGPSLWDGISRAKGGRYHLHRRSLPPLSRLRQEAEQPSEDQKKPKRKSLTLMEEDTGVHDFHKTLIQLFHSRPLTKVHRTSVCGSTGTQ